MEPTTDERSAGNGSSAEVDVLTAPGPGGVAVLGVRGPGATGRLHRMLGRALPRDGEVVYGTLSSGGTPLDEVLVIRRGEGALEVHLHGAPAIVREVARLLASGPGDGADGETGEGGAGPRPSETLEARAAAFAGQCASAWGARLAMDQARGHLRRALDDILARPAPERPAACRALASLGRRAARLFEPTVVALTGPVNAGKSTLFNVLMGQDEAVVSDAPGTTRDAIAGYGTLGGWPVLFVDTAGEREISAQALAQDPHARIEAEGMGLARRAAARAEVVFAIRPAGRADAPPVTGSPQAPGHPIPILSRADESLGSDPADWPEGVLAAEPFPGHARTVIGRAWAEAMGLEPSAAGFVRRLLGVGVPFGADLLAMLEAAGQRAVDGEAVTAPDLGHS